MAVCDLCKGTGRLLKPWYDTTGLMTGFTGDICFKCDGKGTIGEPMTNEEWLRQRNITSKLRGYMSTETLIKLLLAFMIVIFVEASVILGGIILECVR